jgi:hypothetical protein
MRLLGGFGSTKSSVKVGSGLGGNELLSQRHKQGLYLYTNQSIDDNGKWRGSMARRCGGLGRLVLSFLLRRQGLDWSSAKN